MIAIILSLLAALSWGLAPIFDKKSLQIEKNIMNMYYALVIQNR